MNSALVASLVFVCIFGSALLGMYLHGKLPEHHRSSDTKDVVKVANGLVATMSALVLGLLLSSTKGTFDKLSDELVAESAKLVQLDRALANYGPETATLRAKIRQHYTLAVDELFSGDDAKIARLDSPETVAHAEAIQGELLGLAPANDLQRRQQAKALDLAGAMQSTRWMIVMQTAGSLPGPLLCALGLWLSISFAAYGLFAPRNATVVVALCVGSLCVSAALFLILELGTPFDGLVRISDGPLRSALAHLGQ